MHDDERTDLVDIPLWSVNGVNEPLLLNGDPSIAAILQLGTSMSSLAGRVQPIGRVYLYCVLVRADVQPRIAAPALVDIHLPEMEGTNRIPDFSPWRVVAGPGALGPLS